MTDNGILDLIEAQPRIAGRFVDQKRLAGGQPGYFSLLFRAMDMETGRPVALKFYKEGGPGDDDYRRDSFLREARILERLQGQDHIIQLVHQRTNIVLPVLIPGTSIEIPFNLQFFGLEFAESSVEAVLAGGLPDIGTSLRWFREICRGVQRLHARRISHRDLKPGNCLLVNDRATVGDFGTARDYGDGTKPLLARYDNPVGDMLYTALELTCGLGDDQAMCFAADFYSLGAILFELVTLIQLGSFWIDKALDLGQYLVAMPLATRRTAYDRLIGPVSDTWRLPNLQDLNGGLPGVIRDRLNQLYRGLAHLDYRRRTKVFSTIFHELDVCIRLITYEAAYGRYVELRRERRAAREAKRGAPRGDGA